MWWEDIIGIGKFDEELGVISSDGVDLGNRRKYRTANPCKYGILDTYKP
jgi:hypothetical protein